MDISPFRKKFFLLEYKIMEVLAWLLLVCFIIYGIYAFASDYLHHNYRSQHPTKDEEKTREESPDPKEPPLSKLINDDRTKDSIQKVQVIGIMAILLLLIGGVILGTK